MLHIVSPMQTTRQVEVSPHHPASLYFDSRVFYNAVMGKDVLHLHASSPEPFGESEIEEATERGEVDELAARGAYDEEREDDPDIDPGDGPEPIREGDVW